MKHLLCAAAVLLTTVACWATAAGAASGSVSAADRAFVAKVSQGGMFEVAAGRLAAVRGSRQDIRDLGTTELHDHMLVGSKLVSIHAAGHRPQLGPQRDLCAETSRARSSLGQRVRPGIRYGDE